MYMRGMGRYGLKRYRPMRGYNPGLGQTPDVTSTITYLPEGTPAPEGQPGFNQMIATPLTAQQLATLSAQNAAFFGSQAGLGPNPPTITQWLPLIAGGFAVLVLLTSGGGRRR